MLKNKIGYGFFLLFFGLFAILYNEYFTGVLFLAMCFFPIALLILCAISLTGISCKLTSPAFVKNKGEEFPIIVQITNNSFLPVSKMKIVIAYYNHFDKKRVKETLQVSMDKRSTQEVRMHMTSAYCGNIIIQLTSIRIYDLLHIWSLRKRSKESLLIPVLPNIHIEEKDIIEENNKIEIESNQFSPYKGGDDPSEVFQIREYREGDKINRVHWKLTFKQDELMMKEFSHPLNSNILLALDFTMRERMGNRIEIMDALLECIMSLEFSLLEHEHTFSVVWIDVQKEEMKVDISNDSGVYELMDYLLQRNVEESKSILEGTSIDSTKVYSHILYITSMIDVEAVLNMVNSRRDTIVYLYYVRESQYALREEERKVLEELLIQIYEIEIKAV